jgi:hypothetical protein
LKITRDSAASIGRPNVHGIAYQASLGQGQKAKFVERVAFGIRLCCSDYECDRVSRELLTHYSIQTVFLFTSMVGR